MSECAVSIDSKALQHNLARVKKYLLPSQHVMAMIKANAYGHGLNKVAGVLFEADAFGVASLDEALTLRHLGCAHPILVMKGPMGMAEWFLYQRHQLQAVIHMPAQIDDLSRTALAPSAPLWLKYDTGMCRLGFRADEMIAAIQQFSQLEIQQPSVLMTHFSCADNPESYHNLKQSERFNAVLPHWNGLTSIGNSAMILQADIPLGDWVRPGIMLYGVSPFANKTGADFGLTPVMRMCSRIIALKALSPGDVIGYGADYTCQKPMTLAVVAAGYGDGYPRRAPSGTSVVINNTACPLVGRVSMDLLTVDVTDLTSVSCGDEVELWGPALPVEHLAQACEMIPYEILSQVTNRVHRID